MPLLLPQFAAQNSADPTERPSGVAARARRAAASKWASRVASTLAALLFAATAHAVLLDTVDGLGHAGSILCGSSRASTDEQDASSESASED